MRVSQMELGPGGLGCTEEGEDKMRGELLESGMLFLWPYGFDAIKSQIPNKWVSASNKAVWSLRARQEGPQMLVH